MSETIDPHILKNYEILSRIGKGAYGVVWKAKNIKTKKIVALKKVFDAFNNPTDAQRTYREVTYLKHLKNSNIVQLMETYPADNNNDLYMVFEFMETDLHVAIRAKILQPIHRRYIVHQVLKALKYIHSSGLIHRDLKPANILLDSECSVKVADFGLARMVGSLDTDILTDYVATRWFRAPEILLGSKSYSFGVDMWSMGCMMGEMILGKALFSGVSTLNQLEKIIEVLGSPTTADIGALGGQHQIFQNFSRIQKGKLNNILQCEPDELDLIKKLLQYDPNKRLTVTDALAHPYVKDFHNVKEEYSYQGVIQLQLKDDKQYPINTYRDILYKRMDFSKIINLVNKQKQLLQDVTNKKCKLQSQVSLQAIKPHSSTQIEKKLQRALSNTSVKAKLKNIVKQDISVKNSSKVMNNTNQSISPSHAQKSQLARLLSKYNF